VFDTCRHKERRVLRSRSRLLIPGSARRASRQPGVQLRRASWWAAQDAITQGSMAGSQHLQYGYGNRPREKIFNK